MDSDQMQAAADRLSSKLDGLDLDSDERAVLGAILGTGASSVEPVGDEVEGFAFDSFMGLQGTTQGHPGFGPAPEAITLTYGSIMWRYTKQDDTGGGPVKTK